MLHQLAKFQLNRIMYGCVIDGLAFLPIFKGDFISKIYSSQGEGVGVNQSERLKIKWCVLYLDSSKLSLHLSLIHI